MAEIFWPTDPSLITEGYGWADWRQGIHDGIDFGIPQGTELRATAAGTVRNNDAGVRDGAGVDISTPDGWKARHWHVSKFLVPDGSWVNAGDVIALSGGARGTWGAGFSTGAHLHWGIMVGGRWVDPASLSPQTFGSNPTTKLKGNKDMLMIHKPNGDGQLRFAIFGTSFWLEFVGQDAANGFAKQIGASSVEVSESFWAYCKKSAQAPVQTTGGSGSVSIDASAIAKAVNDDAAKRMQA